MQFSDFLTSYPLYSKCQLDLPIGENIKGYSWPAIIAFCPKCNSTQTFAYVVTGLHIYPEYPRGPFHNKVVELIYACAACKSTNPNVMMEADNGLCYYLIR